MPLYDYQCGLCGIIEDVWADIEQQWINCPCCRIRQAKRLMSPTRINCDIYDGTFDENLADARHPHGRYLKSRQHRKDVIKKLGLYERG
jgi:putative FmdB family regulatory protein